MVMQGDHYAVVFSGPDVGLIFTGKGVFGKQ
jgi:hypothetical protein